MHFSEQLLPGTWLVRLNRFEDERGTFVKTFAASVYQAALSDCGIAAFDFKEEFYSTSSRDVIRGMHFQLPPYDHVKIVYCAKGKVDDVLLDLRRGAGYGAVARVRLDATSPSLVFVPKGVAHGFRSLEDESLMVYKTSTEHSPQHDAGIRFDSFGLDWECERPILSSRDSAHPPFTFFQSPF